MTLTTGHSQAQRFLSDYFSLQRVPNEPQVKHTKPIHNTRHTHGDDAMLTTTLSKKTPKHLKFPNNARPKG